MVFDTATIDRINRWPVVARRFLASAVTSLPFAFENEPLLVVFVPCLQASGADLQPNLLSVIAVKEAPLSSRDGLPRNATITWHYMLGLCSRRPTERPES